MGTDSSVKNLVLIGGGHSHAIALKLFGTKPLPGVRITAIADTPQAPYSGMLPGYVAGYYNFDECHIDLPSLAQFARAELLIDRAIGLDLENNKVLCAKQPPVPFDVLSIDIGSSPETLSVPGAAEYAIPAKPVPQLLTSWKQIVEDAIANPQMPVHLGIVGGGAGGVELALAMQSRLQQIFKDASQPAENVKIHLLHRSAELLPTHNRGVRRRLQEILVGRGVELHLGETACLVEQREAKVCVRCESGLTVECSRLFWVTGASAQSWLRSAGLATDDAGFILVRDTLQSISHSHVFASGDVAAIIDRPRPKAGVFAVRQGKPLFENLRLALQGKPPKPHIPQKQYLALIGTGNGEALASWGAIACGASPLLWRWKDCIDRRFMEQFKNLPPNGRSRDL